MTYECSGGKPQSFVNKKALKAGDVVKAGQYIRFESSQNLTDDQVAAYCNIVLAPLLCQPTQDQHLTYYHVTNTLIVWEAKLLRDFTIPTTPAGTTYYLLEPIWGSMMIVAVALATVAVGIWLIDIIRRILKGQWK
jgi:hypothetical protein